MPQIVVRVDERGDPPVDPPGVNLACISRYDMRSVPLRTGTAAKERMKINDLIPLGTQLDAIFESDPPIPLCNQFQGSDCEVECPSQSSRAWNLNQMKAALLIEERGLSSLNNLTQEEVHILQRMRLTRAADRSEFMSIFIGKLFGLSDSFPSRLGLKVHLVVDKDVADTIVMAVKTAKDDRLTTVEDLLMECVLDISGSVVCQGIFLHTSTPLYFLRETAQQLDGFIHLVYKFNDKQ